MANLPAINTGQRTSSCTLFPQVEWDTRTGGQMSRKITKYVDQGVEKSHHGTVQPGEVTLSKLYRPGDESIMQKLIETMTQGTKQQPFEIVEKTLHTDRARSPLEGTGQISYTGCRVSSYTLPETNQQSDGMAMITFVCTFEDQKVG